MTHQSIERGRSLAFAASTDVRAALRRIGRTEDVRFSPDGRRLALAGLKADRLLVLDVETDLAGPVPSIALTGFVELESRAFDAPHGLDWVDEDILIVANREGDIAVVALPQERGRAIEIEPVRVIGKDATDLVKTPGSLAVRPVGLGLIELLVCNNYVDHVTRHLIDRRNGFAVIASEIMLDQGIRVPDGIAHSPSGEWIAISNHDERLVFLFRDDDRLDRSSEPQGILAFESYPHGLKFSRDGRTLLVADAGAPFVHVFRSEDGDWSGRRTPSDAIRVLSNSDFRRGKADERSGGPKGVDLTPDDRLLVTTCECRTLAFFDMRGLFETAAAPERQDDSGEVDRARRILVRYLSASASRAQQEGEALRRAGAFDRQAVIVRQHEIRAMIASRSWRLTAPLRSLNAALARARRRR